MNRIVSMIGAIFMLFVVIVAAKSLTHKSVDASIVKANDTAKVSADDDDTSAREQWEYLVVAGGNTTNLSSSTSSSMRKEPKVQAFRENFVLAQNMDKLGAQGWELVSIAGSPIDPVYYFKRKK